MPFPGGERFLPRMQQFEPGGVGGQNRRPEQQRGQVPGKSVQPAQGAMEQFETHKAEAEALGFSEPIAANLAALKMTPTREQQRNESDARRLRFGRWLAERNAVNEGTTETVPTRIAGSSAEEVLESAYAMFGDSVRQAEEERARQESARVAEIRARRQAAQEQKDRRAENVRGYQEYLRSQGQQEDRNVQG